jgi:hypothetical protein
MTTIRPDKRSRRRLVPEHDPQSKSRFREEVMPRHGTGSRSKEEDRWLIVANLEPDCGSSN